MSSNPCVNATSTFPPGPTTDQQFADLVKDLVANHADSVADTLDSMNIGQCMTKDKQVIKSKTKSKTSQMSVGCEQVALQTQLSVALNSNTACSMSSAESSLSSDLLQENQVEIEIDGVTAESDFNVTVKQENKSKTKVFNFSSQAVQAQMVSSIQGTMTSFANSLQDTSNAISAPAGSPIMQANPQGQKSISDQVSAVVNSTSQTQIAETVATTVSKIVQSNGLKLKVSSVQCQKFKIDVKQINVNNYVIQSVNEAIVNSVFGQDIKNAVAATATTEQKQERKTTIIPKDKGKAAAIGTLILVSLIMGLFFAAYSNISCSGYRSFMMMIIILGGCGVMFVVGCILRLIGILVPRLRRIGIMLITLSLIISIEYGCGYAWSIRVCMFG